MGAGGVGWTSHGEKAVGASSEDVMKEKGSEGLVALWSLQGGRGIERPGG